MQREKNKDLLAKKLMKTAEICVFWKGLGGVFSKRGKSLSFIIKIALEI